MDIETTLNKTIDWYAWLNKKFKFFTISQIEEYENI